MLCLDRRVSQTIVVDVPPSDEPRQIEITVTRLKSFRAVLGIEAPKEMLISRGEHLGSTRPQLEPVA